MKGWPGSAARIAALALALAACGDDEASEPPTEGTESRPEPATEPPTPAPRRGDDVGGRTQVVLLGSGTPVPDPERSGPCVAVVVDGVPYLVDAGPGVVRRAVAAGLEPAELTRVFLTHLHSDHTVGLPDLLLSTWVVGRDVPLHVHGPPGTEAMVEHLAEAWAEDRRIRTTGLEGKAPLRVEAHDEAPGVVHRDARVTVTAFAVDHGSWEHAWGHRFETPDRTVVVSGDTAATDAIVRACDGCDVLVHEVYAAERYRSLPESGQAYHGAFHTSARELGELAARARPKRLVLYHHLLWGAEPEELVAEVREAFDGDVRFGRDLGVY
jgi:ribonuclease Z